MKRTTLHERIAQVIGEQSFREIGEITGTNHETARRYVQGHPPSIEFLTALCDHFRVNAEWLLCGEGAMQREDIRGHALKQAQPTELLGAVAEMMQRLIERVDRLELVILTFESRLRVQSSSRGRVLPVNTAGGEIPSSHGEIGVVSVPRSTPRSIPRAAGGMADAVAPGPRRAADRNAQARRA